MIFMKKLGMLPAITCMLLNTGFLTSCRDDEARYEVLTKLRAIGVESDPFVLAASTVGNPTVANLTFRAVVPKGETVSVEAYTDDAAKYAQILPITVVAGSEAYEERESFRLFSVQATAVIPAADKLIIPSFPGYVSLRYGLKLSAGSEIEKIVGNTVVFADDREELTWQDSPPTVNITSLVAGQTISSSTDLQGAVVDSHGEKFKVSWFVSSGEVKNKRASATEWSKIAKGEQTVIFTARGTKTAAFAWAAIDVQVE